MALAVCGWAGLAIVLLATAASAQFSAVSDPNPRFEWSGHVDAAFRHQFEAETDRGDEFDRWQASLAGTVGGPINESILLGLSGRYRYESFDFNLENGRPAVFGGTALPRDPWNSINTIDVTPHATVLVGNQFRVVAGVPIRWAGESGSRENGFIAGVSALAEWQPNDSLAIGAGIGVTSQLEGEAETFPLVTLRWQINESLAIATEGRFAQGGLLELAWGPAEAIRLRVSVGWERTRFRLDENGTTLDRNGIGEITQLPVEVGVRFQPVPGFLLDFNAGVVFAGRLRVETDGGRKLYDQAYDPAPTLGIRITIPFGLTPSAPTPPPATAPDTGWPN